MLDAADPWEARIAQFGLPLCAANRPGSDKDICFSDLRFIIHRDRQLKLARLVLNACASGLGLKTESEQVRWLTTISDPTEERIPLQNSPG
jgi:hypothetical protein